MQFQFDLVGFGQAVQRVLAIPPLAWTGKDVVPALGLGRRLGRFLLRQTMGAYRWKQWQRGRRLSEGLVWIRQRMRQSSKPVLAYIVPYDVVQMQSGGGQRILGIAKSLAVDFNVFILSLRTSSQPFFKNEISPDVALVGVPEDEVFDRQVRDHALKLSGDFGKVPPLLAVRSGADWLPEFQTVVQELGREVKAWVLVSPMAMGLVKEARQPRNACIAYDVHDDILYFLGNAFGCVSRPILDRAIDLEQQVLGEATVAAFCMEEDRAIAAKRYPLAVDKMVVVPNGVDMSACRWIPPRQAMETSRAVGLEQPVAVFVGAHHKPNLDAADWIVRELAPVFTNVIFVVMGMHLVAYRKFGGAEPGKNVVFTGPVSEEIKEAVFALADVGLAPMKSGTGSSLKIPDYVAHGKVVVGTPIGLRGVEELLAFESVIASEDVRGTLKKVLERLERDPESYTEPCRVAREWVAAHLDWTVAAKPLVDALKARLER